MRLFSLVPLMLAACPALARDAVPPADEPEQEQDGAIVVVADRLVGQLDVAQEPIATFDQTDIRALGASSVADLLGALAPQTGSGRGRGDGTRVILVNGQRIANFRELRNYPAEAIRRVEILPEEVALRMGFAANARVVNMILKDNFRSRRVEAEYAAPTRGGFDEWQGEATLLKIDGPRRLSLTATVQDRSPLFEAERGVIQSGAPEAAAYRTLIADSREFGLNLGWSTGLGKDGIGGQLSLNANATRTDTRSGSGLDALSLPLERTGRDTTVSGGMGLNTRFGAWQFALTGDVSHGENVARIDRFSGVGFDTATSNTDRLESLLTLTGQPLRLPAGPVSVTFKGGYSWGNIRSSDTRSALNTDLTRGTLSGGLNLVLPLTSRREGAMPGLGDITLNLGGGRDHVSDFATVRDWNAGLTWSPVGKLSLQATYLVNEVAPSLSKLGSPLTVSYNVPVYDFTRGESVLVPVTLGGNPLLRKETQRDWKFSLTWPVPVKADWTLMVEYFRNRSSDVTADFPLLTSEIEAAYPGRASRDAGGRLAALDARPITFANQSASRLRWGFNLLGSLGKPRPGDGARSGGMMGRMMGGGAAGRWGLGLYHTVQFTSRVMVAPGGPVLDLLGGDSLSPGGTPRHTIELNGSLFRKGKGLFLSGTWNAPTRITASGAPGTSDLRFGGLAKVNLNLFIELGEQGNLAEKAPFTKDLRLSLRLQNLLDARRRVTDGSGQVPLSYQPDYLDPRGRVIELELRKVL